MMLCNMCVCNIIYTYTCYLYINIYIYYIYINIIYIYIHNYLHGLSTTQDSLIPGMLDAVLGCRSRLSERSLAAVGLCLPELSVGGQVADGDRSSVAKLGSEVGVPTSQIGRRKTMVVHLYKVMVIHDLGDVRGYPLTWDTSS